jgi:hypothetical protein
MPILTKQEAARLVRDKKSPIPSYSRGGAAPKKKGGGCGCKK